MAKTAKESDHVIHEFDHDHTGTLDKQEFASFIVNFANQAKVELVNMLDFMLVVMSLKDNADAEKDFVETLGTVSEYDYWYG